MRRTLSVLLTLIAACDRAGSVSDWGTCDPNFTLVTDSSIGPIHVGEPVPALRARCPATIDTVVAVPMTGWTDSVRALRFVLVGVPLTIFHESERVTALRVANPAFRTIDSVGVGTSIARFRGRRGVRVEPATHSPLPTLLDREHCGMSFSLSGWGSLPPATDAPPLTGAALATWADSIVVTQVVVSGCRGQTSDPGIDSVSEHIADSLRAADSLASAPLPAPALTPAPITPSIPPPAQPPTTARGDAGTVTASASELAELQRSLVIPVQGIASSQLRDTYVEPRGGRVHEAIDIPAARGTPVVAATDGRLLKLFNSKAGGLMVYAADAADRFILMYGHLDRYADGLVEGMPLRRGQVIGYVGTTGNAPIGTPHLHFAISRGRPSAAWWKGTPVNPYPLLRTAR